jgi:hypothetical protein
MKNPRYETPRMRRIIRYRLVRKHAQRRLNAMMRSILDNVRMASGPMMFFK